VQKDPHPGAEAMRNKRLENERAREQNLKDAGCEVQ
jgi:hypothetical protein